MLSLADLLPNAQAVKLNPSEKKLTLDSGVEIAFDKCLLATGGRPRNLPVFSEASADLKEKVSLYRSIPDYQKLDDLVGKVESVLVVGGGFLGSELAVGMASRGKHYCEVRVYLLTGPKGGCVHLIEMLHIGGVHRGKPLQRWFCVTGKSRELKVTQLFPEEGNLGLILPTSLCKWTTDKVRQEGVTVQPGTTVASLSLSEEGKVLATLSDGSEVREILF